MALANNQELGRQAIFYGSGVGGFGEVWKFPYFFTPSLRNCDDPAPSDGGQSCIGESSESQYVFQDDCQGILSFWALSTEWNLDLFFCTNF